MGLMQAIGNQGWSISLAIGVWPVVWDCYDTNRVTPVTKPAHPVSMTTTATEKPMSQSAPTQGRVTLTLLAFTKTSRLVLQVWKDIQTGRTHFRAPKIYTYVKVSKIKVAY
jgi:hypothetical protein